MIFYYVYNPCEPHTQTHTPHNTNFDFIIAVVFLQEAPVLRLNLRRTSGDKKVSWNSNTIDNEHMNKKKSKCTYY